MLKMFVKLESWFSSDSGNNLSVTVTQGKQVCSKILEKATLVCSIVSGKFTEKQSSDKDIEDQVMSLPRGS